MVGEQLKDICRREPRSAELIARDLQVEAMSITEAEKKIKAFADGHKTGNFACVTPGEADNILREFYGLPEPEAIPAPPQNRACRRFWRTRRTRNTICPRKRVRGSCGGRNGGGKKLPPELETALIRQSREA